MNVFYNEIEPYPAQWLRNLGRDGRIPEGFVEERSIVDLRPEELVGFDQAHFFAGIGVWAYALRVAGWPESEVVWTGSCPCQPFSQAGKRGGKSDARHLWPDWFRLIKERRPATIFGEQVASPDGLGWLDSVRADLEGEGYSFAAFDLCAAGVGAPHIRQRLYFCARLADADRGESGRRVGGDEVEAISGRTFVGRYDETRGLADDDERCRLQWEPGLPEDGNAPRRDDSDGRGAAGGLGHHHHQGLEGRRLSAERAGELFVGQTGLGRFWSGADWLYCQDGKLRPVEPGTFPLAHGAPSRVGRIRAYGNGLVGPLAAVFVRASMESFL